MAELNGGQPQHNGHHYPDNQGGPWRNGTHDKQTRNKAREPRALPGQAGALGLEAGIKKLAHASSSPTRIIRPIRITTPTISANAGLAGSGRPWRIARSEAPQ